MCSADLVSFEYIRASIYNTSEHGGSFAGLCSRTMEAGVCRWHGPPRGVEDTRAGPGCRRISISGRSSVSTHRGRLRMVRSRTHLEISCSQKFIRRIFPALADAAQAIGVRPNGENNGRNDRWDSLTRRHRWTAGTAAARLDAQVVLAVSADCASCPSVISSSAHAARHQT